jgi:hypothetical protein
LTSSIIGGRFGKEFHARYSLRPMEFSNVKPIVAICKKILCNRNLKSEKENSFMSAGKSAALPETLNLSASQRANGFQFACEDIILHTFVNTDKMKMHWQGRNDATGEDRQWTGHAQQED